MDGKNLYYHIKIKILELVNIEDLNKNEDQLFAPCEISKISQDGLNEDID